MRSLICLLAAFLLAQPARGDDGKNSFSSGNDFLTKCTPALASFDGAPEATGPDSPPIAIFKEAFALGQCGGYVHGFTEGAYVRQILHGERSGSFCLPKGSIPSSQALRVIIAYMKAHPERLHLPIGGLATFAYEEAFPCKPRTPGAPD